MLDLSSEKGRIVQAALKLAAQRPWRDVSMRDIAEDAGITLADMRKSFGSKTQIITGYMRALDDAVLANAPKSEEAMSPRDMLFEVLMARLDLMAEHKPALKSIAADTTFDSTLAKSFLNSQRWMLLAAGLDGDGPRGVMRSVGLASLFSSVFRIWLDDDDPGQARTMAALDRRLRRGEGAMSGIDQACDAVSGFFNALKGGFERATSRARTAREDSAHDDGFDAGAGPEPSPGNDGNGFTPGPNPATG